MLELPLGDPMKYVLLFFITSLFVSNAHSAYYADSTNKKNKDSIYGKLGFSGGGVVLGATWERRKNSSISYGAYGIMVGDDDAALINQIGITALGAMAAAHYYKKAWDFYVQPGFGIVMVKSKNGAQSADETTLGPAMAIGIKYQYSRNVSYGLEKKSVHSWFGSDHKGQLGEVMLFTFHMGI